MCSSSSVVLSLSSAPALPIGAFPSGRYSRADAGCTLHSVKTYKDFEDLELKYERYIFVASKMIIVVPFDGDQKERRSVQFFFCHLPFLYTQICVVAVQS